MAARRPSVKLIDESTIDSEVKAQLRAKARAQVAKEKQEQDEQALYAQFLEEERRGLDPQQEIKYIQLDMAGHSDRIIMDGVIFFHGMTYAVPKNKYESLREIVARGWDHETEIGFANRGRNNTPRPDPRVVSPRNPSGVRIAGVM